MEPKTGDKAICSSCKQEIEFVGLYWDHIGPLRPRHPATPVEQATAPLQPKPNPAWMAELTDSREREQVIHARSYTIYHQGAGAPGHGQFLLIAKLAAMLDRREPFESGGPA